ncbi:MAG: L-serine ammonia-lyase, iron-sulfur-dependent, subunit alpha [Verrucomicrobiota bacterium]|nr:L-serine ammonia-lyase, iron-sulfur-dependent, subunit alpha [Verrucomicrobiota bacterium]
MKTIRELYRMGFGPSSSHTMGPARAAEKFAEKLKNDSSCKITLYGSLAATGRGHLTDKVILGKIPRAEIFWKPDQELPKHPNGMVFEAIDKKNKVVHSKTEYSIGGGALLSDQKSQDIYPINSIEGIIKECVKKELNFCEYCKDIEGQQILNYLDKVWKLMSEAVQRGLNTEGILPGGLDLRRKAQAFFRKSKFLNDDIGSNAKIASYSYAVAEENAAGHRVVTAPTCGASGVVPSVLFFLKDKLSCDKESILNALMTAGLFGNIVKKNASISGAEVGCQGEIGTASAMAAAAAAQLIGCSLREIEYAAEMAMEHHFGLTCDPVDGLVQIPCIERNAHAAVRALNCAYFSMISSGPHKISFDDAVSVMYETGKALPVLYRETSRGGLAKIYKKNITNAIHE